MAYLDEIRACASAAVKSKNERDMCLVAEIFATRFYGLESGYLPEPSDCKAISRSKDGFTISFHDAHLIFRRDKSRWAVSRCADYEPQAADSHDAAVNMAGAPFAFLEGIEYAMGCLEAVGCDYQSLFQVEVEEAKSRCLKMMEYMRELERKKDRFLASLARPKFVKRATAEAAAVCEDKIPDPPTTTVTLEVARVAFKGVSGVYFLWLGDSIDYVGRANCIGSRLSPSHHRAVDEHYVSIVKMPAWRTWLVEPYYIWKFCPPLNGNVQEAAKLGFSKGD